MIVLTGWGQESDRQRATEAGFDRHLTKPVDPAALNSMLSADAATADSG
jgi:CheY-like chemotaxis protein